MSSSNNSNFMYSRLYLKNVPSEITKNQLRDVFFPELEDIVIHFPKPNPGYDKKIAFIQFATANEGKLARQIINTMEWRSVVAKFANKTNTDNKAPSSSASNGAKADPEIPDFDMELKKCSFCGSLNSAFACNECSTAYSATFYCSEDHQGRDWSRHKIECRPLPQLRRIEANGDSAKNKNSSKSDSEKSSEDEESESSSEKRKFCVRSAECPTTPGARFLITHVPGNRIIYVLPVAYSLIYENQLKQIRDGAPNAQKLHQEPQIQDYVLAPLNDLFYHRARVQDTFDTDSNGFNVKVSFIDVGSEARLKWTSLRRLKYRLRGMPTHIFKVVLEGVGRENEQMTKYLKDICDNGEQLELLKMTTSKFTQERRATFLHVDTGRVITEEMFQPQSEIQQAPKIFFNNELVPKIDREKRVKLAVADSSQLEERNFLACMPHDLLPQYLEMNNQIQEYCLKSLNVAPSYMPAFNEICLLKYNNKWHRAIKSKGTSVILIDKMMSISFEDESPPMRRIPQLFAKQFFTSLCYVEGSRAEDTERLLEAEYAYFDVTFDAKTKCVVLKCVE